MEQEVQLIYPLIRMPVSEIPCFVINLILDCIKPFFCAVSESETAFIIDSFPSMRDAEISG